MLEEALKEVERVIKLKGGSYKLSNKPQIIGDSAKDKDIEDIMKMPGERSDGSEGGSDDAEDNDEGMGDIDLGDDLGGDDDIRPDIGVGEEEQAAGGSD